MAPPRTKRISDPARAGLGPKRSPGGSVTGPTLTALLGTMTLTVPPSIVCCGAGLPSYATSPCFQ